VRKLFYKILIILFLIVNQVPLYAQNDVEAKLFEIFTKVISDNDKSAKFELFSTNDLIYDLFTIDPKFGEDAVEYWVRAKINSNTESIAGNHKGINGISIIQWKDDANIDDSNQRKTFELLYNYPNPFNPTTTITYSLPEKQDVKLKVYDPFGRDIAELVNGVKAEGKHSVNFDGSNLASGVYYYTITAGNYTETKKLMLLK
jgi:hypothetical protein